MTLYLKLVSKDGTTWELENMEHPTVYWHDDVQKLIDQASLDPNCDVSGPIVGTVFRTHIRNRYEYFKFVTIKNQCNLDDAEQDVSSNSFDQGYHDGYRDGHNDATHAAKSVFILKTIEIVVDGKKLNRTVLFGEYDTEGKARARREEVIHNIDLQKQIISLLGINESSDIAMDVWYQCKDIPDDYELKGDCIELINK